MIVFDLRCGHGHVFEAWFGSSAAYEDQRRGGHVRCPLCDDADVTKAVMAPNVAPKGNRRAAAATPSAPNPVPTPDDAKRMLQALATAQAEALRGSQWVGGDFARRARAMHEGNEDRTGIHGQATLADARALAEDGIPVAPLPLPVVPPDAMN